MSKRTALFFILPGAVSAIAFLLLWRAGSLARPAVAGTVCAAGIVAQALAPAYSPVWLVALLLNVAAAVYFAIRFQVD